MNNKTKISITKKNIFVGTLGLLAVVFTFTIINTNSQNENLTKQYLREAQNLITLLEVSAAEDLDQLQIDKLRKNIYFVKQNSLVKEVLIFDKDGYVITDGAIKSNKKFEQLSDSLINEAFTHNSIAYQMNEREIVLYMPIDLSFKRLGGIKLVYSLSELRRTEISILFNNLKYAAIIFVVGIVLLFLFIRKIVRPVKDLIRSTEEVSKGNYDEKIDIKTRDELETLADSFNEMVRNLKTSRDELIEAKEKAEKSDRLKTEFLAQMSHEIRTPINAIVNFTEMLKTEFEHRLYGETKEAFDIIQSSSERLIRTIDLILNMAELQSGSFKTTPEEVNLVDEIITPIVNEFKLRAQVKSLKISVDNKTDRSKIIADKYSLTQMFANLLDNAIKYTEKGEIKISVERDKNSAVVAQVQDTGIGISEDFLPFLFEPFMQEESGYTRRFEGTGLGLSLVKKYCEVNNAEIKVDSKKNSGTTFTIRFDGVQNEN